MGHALIACPKLILNRFKTFGRGFNERPPPPPHPHLHLPLDVWQNSLAVALRTFLKRTIEAEILKIFKNIQLQPKN